MKKRTVGVLLAAFFAMALTGCGDKQPQPGEVKGYDKGEEYLSIWVHSIEDTEEGQCYRKSVDAFNKKYDGKYFADIEFIPRNDSGGGYSDKINASVMSGDLPDVLTVDGPNIAAYAENGIIQPLAKLTDEEKKQVEDLVNKWINEDLPVTIEEMSKEDAIKSGAECMFIEKYPDIVTVYSIGDVSKELCGGPHVKNTKVLGTFKIKKEEACSAGVRRIKAILE